MMRHSSGTLSEKQNPSRAVRPQFRPLGCTGTCLCPCPVIIRAILSLPDRPLRKFAAMQKLASGAVGWNLKHALTFTATVTTRVSCPGGVSYPLLCRGQKAGAGDHGQRWCAAAAFAAVAECAGIAGFGD